jgi:hypothetical protein
MIPFSTQVVMMLRLTAAYVLTRQLLTGAALFVVLGSGVLALMARLIKTQTYRLVM